MTKIPKFNVWVIEYWELKFVCFLVLVFCDLVAVYIELACSRFSLQLFLANYSDIAILELPL